MADTLDVVTLAEAKAALNITATTWDSAELPSYITAVSRRIDTIAGPVVNRAVTDTLDGGRRTVRLTKAPVSAVTSVTEYENTTATVLTAESTSSQVANQYVLRSGAGVVIRRSSGGDALFPQGRGNVVVVYTAGRAATTAAVDSLFKQAAAIMLANLWRTEQGGGTKEYGQFIPAPSGSFPTFAVPNAVIELLADELAAPRMG